MVRLSPEQAAFYLGISVKDLKSFKGSTGNAALDAGIKEWQSKRQEQNDAGKLVTIGALTGGMGLVDPVLYNNIYRLFKSPEAVTEEPQIYVKKDSDLFYFTSDGNCHIKYKPLKINKKALNGDYIIDPQELAWQVGHSLEDLKNGDINFTHKPIADGVMTWIKNGYKGPIRIKSGHPITIGNPYEMMTSQSGQKSTTPQVDAPQTNQAASDSTQVVVSPTSQATQQQAKQEAVDPEDTIGNETQYTVQKGDTLWKIAKDRNSGASNKEIMSYIRQIVNLNNLKNGELIYVGQELSLPETWDSATEAYVPPKKTKKTVDTDQTYFIDMDERGNPRTGNKGKMKVTTAAPTDPDYYGPTPSQTPIININIAPPQERLSTLTI